MPIRTSLFVEVRPVMMVLSWRDKLSDRTCSQQELYERYVVYFDRAADSWSFS